MKVSQKVIVFWSMLVAIHLPISSYAITDLVVTLNGDSIGTTSPNPCPATPPPPGQATCEIILSDPGPAPHNYGAVSINGLNGQPAKVVVVDGNQESITLQNATIIANQPFSDTNPAVIQFWATFNAPPTPLPAARVQYERDGTGTMRRGNNAATNDKVTITGWYIDLVMTSCNEEIGTAGVKVVPNKPIPATYGDFTMPPMTEEPTAPTCPLTGLRRLKAQIKFKADYIGDQLRIYSLPVLSSAIVPGGNVGANVGIYDAYSEQHVQEKEREKTKH